MLHSIEIEKFRCFNNLSFKFGRKITIIAGQNAIGKSTLLGIIGHCSQAKKPPIKPLLQPSFRTEFSEIFKFSDTFDKPKEHIFKINYCDNTFSDINAYKMVRSYYNEDRGLRFTPRGPDEKGKNTSSKLDFPTLYIGLSRLYPVGEAKNESLSNSKSKLKDVDKEWMSKNHKKILSLHYDNILETQNVEISGDVFAKKTYGLVTDQYDYYVNSAGQDNLSQILAAVLSFKHLKENMTAYNGGVLLIDEIDAVLHPAAQLNLIQFLYEQSSDLNLQIVATTHSLKLLEYIFNKYETERKSLAQEFYDTEIIYLSQEGTNNVLKLDDLTWAKIESNLLLLVGITRRDNPAIPIYSEDEIGRWFLEQLIPEHITKLKFIEASFSASQLIDMRKQDQKYFRTVLILLDGDQYDNRIISSFNNILVLPENGYSPEKVFYEFLNSLDSNDEFWKRHIIMSTNITFNYQLFHEHPLEKFDGENESKKLHNWFNSYKDVFEELDLFGYWKDQNKEIVNRFRIRFKEAFNSVAKHHNVGKI